MTSPRTPRWRHFAWLVFLATCVLSFVGFGLTVNTASIFWGPVQESLGVDLSTVTLMSTVSGLAGAIALGIASPLFERINLKVFLSVTVVLLALAYFASAGATSIYVLYAANLVLGVTKAVAVMLSIPILLGNWFSKHLGIVTGIAGAMTAVGGAVFSPMIGAVIEDQGWRFAYALTGIIVLVTLLPFTVFVTKLRPTGTQTPYGFDPGSAPGEAAVATGVRARDAYTSLPFACFVLAGVLYQFAGSLVQHIPTYLHGQGFALTVASAIFSLLLLGASVGKFAMGAAIDQLRPVLAIGMFTLIAVFGWSGLYFFGTEGSLSTASFAGGIAQGINLVAVVVLVRRVFGTLEYSKILGPILMAGSLANAAGVYVHGLLVDGTGGYGLSFVLNVTMFLAAFGLLILALRRNPGGSVTRGSADGSSTDADTEFATGPIARR
ncbi:MFS transporter [Brachybacterium ginsengisoli]|uniref:MFS transporter n=1 Tax=Brachybacterium ginsengisoli TaxID=1331682 RepID=A0A291H0A2_9MICO|nr:MFS transporter [Brachybacterium ginsengisoli]ATG55899.1 MFS transporter [Brachybacterium ginsengisoli]